ncbi:MAG TPA: peptide ABC transporter substrate-binding protein, partial [Thermomicrobiales bacterium]|nr:peptide ABC transporter substrate-binding protein [Thermomicrobiales bacterium]
MSLGENESDSLITVAGKVLNERQLNRRKMMKGLLAGGAFATLAGMPIRAGAQTPEASPVASPAASPVPYTGEVASDQEMRLPLSEPVTMDPGVSYGDSELEVFANIFDGLVGIDPETGKIVNRIAESYTANADFSQFTFKIRQDVTWSDGTPLNANDFEYSWKRVLDPNTISQYTSAMEYLKNGADIEAGKADLDTLGVKATDDYTLVVDCAGPSPFFPLVAATWTYVAVPKHVIDAQGDAWVEAKNIVSSGPFKMTDWTHNQQIVMEPNDKYWGDQPKLTKATYRIFKDPTTQAYVAFENNELDYAEPEGPDLDRVLADPKASANLLQFPASNCYFIVCDTTNTPTDKPEFRQALYKSIDRNLIATQILKNQFLPAFTVMSPDIPGNNPAAALTESVDEAKALLQTAGIDPGSVNLEIVYVSDTARYKTIAEYLQSAWQTGLGITVKLSPIENAAYSDWRASRETQSFSTYTGTWGSDYADASNWLNQNFTSSSDHYRDHWKDDDFDALCAKAVINKNTEERDQQYAAAEKILVDQAAIIPMYRGKNFRALKP